MRKLAILCAFLGLLGTVTVAQAQNNKLFNGNLDLTSGSVYFDGFDPSVADDVPGWELYLGATDGSYVMVAEEAGQGHDVDMGIGPANGGLKTAVSSRPRVIAGNTYTASVTFDYYFNAGTTSYFIDWFAGDGGPLGSSGGLLLDLNGPFGYDPYGQKFEVSGVAPVGAARAGVRFESGNASYAGLAADNFSLVPEPSTVVLMTLASLGLLSATRRYR